MGIEMVALVIFAQLVEASVFLEQNAGLLVGTFLILILSATGSITVVRRWRSE
jgi:hypothetical protein